MQRISIGYYIAVTALVATLGGLLVAVPVADAQPAQTAPTATPHAARTPEQQQAAMAAARAASRSVLTPHGANGHVFTPQEAAPNLRYSSPKIPGQQFPTQNPGPRR